MYQTPQVITVESLINSSRNQVELKVGGRSVWAEARPVSINSWKMRFILAWKVFTGQADALVWYGNQGKQK